MKVLVTGPREWDDWGLIRDALKGLGPDTVIIHGDARGLDKMAGWLAKNEFGYPVKPYPADWAGNGKKAGPVRNRLMYDRERPELVIAFCIGDYKEAKRLHESGEHKSGTVDMVEYARSCGCPIQFVSKGSQCQDQA